MPDFISLYIGNRTTTRSAARKPASIFVVHAPRESARISDACRWVFFRGSGPVVGQVGSKQIDRRRIQWVAHCLVAESLLKSDMGPFGVVVFDEPVPVLAGIVNWPRWYLDISLRSWIPGSDLSSSIPLHEVIAISCAQN